jgi:hypothetical protein
MINISWERRVCWTKCKRLCEYLSNRLFINKMMQFRELFSLGVEIKSREFRQYQISTRNDFNFDFLFQFSQFSPPLLTILPPSHSLPHDFIFFISSLFSAIQANQALFFFAPDFKRSFSESTRLLNPKTPILPPNTKFLHK